MSLPRTFRATAVAAAATFTALLAAPASATETPTPPAGCQGDPSNTWINVAVDGLRSSRGLLAVTLYADNPSKFLAKKGSIDVLRFPAEAGTMRACIFVPKPAVYAIAVYHDEDGSRKINRSGLGLPQEGFGFSNNPSTLAGIPAFRSVRLNVPRTGLTTRIHIRYP